MGKTRRYQIQIITWRQWTPSFLIFSKIQSKKLNRITREIHSSIQHRLQKLEKQDRSLISTRTAAKQKYFLHMLKFTYIF